MTEKIRLTEEQKAENKENIGKIINLTAEMKELCAKLHGVACITAYTNSVANLETKNEKYMPKDAFHVSEEEKEILRKLRAGEAKVSEMAANVESTGSDEQQSTPSHKKGKGKSN